MNNNYKRNLSFGFGISLLILIVSTIASYISINGLLHSSKEVTNTHTFIKELDNVITILVDAETGQRGFLLTGENVFLDPYRGATQKATTALENIRSYVVSFPQLQTNFDRLEVFVNDRLNILRELIDKKRAGKSITIADLKNGKEHMDEARRLVTLMETTAQKSLSDRIERFSSFATYTRLLIVFASLLALLITVVFYLRLNRDFEERRKLQEDLVEKDRSINDRIRMIHDIANKISLGNYQIRINSEDKDTLGSLADSLNKMAASLEHSFSLLSDREWLQTGAAELNEKMMVGSDLYKIAENVINYVAEYTDSQVGAIYMLETAGKLKLYHSYRLSPEGSKKIISLGEGLPGQSAADGKVHLLENINESALVLNYASGSIMPKNIIAFPLSSEGSIKGVIELAKINRFSQRDLSFIDVVAPRIAAIINRMQNRIMMQELLEETQSQTEELHTQHSELQNLNAELEANTQKLQASEEELRVQQQELLTVNQNLKDRSNLLEEKNQMIQERNIEIQRKAEELALTTKYKSEFLANMSHELRTPLNSILLLSGLMISNSEKKLSEEHIEFAKVIQSSGNGLLALIDEILDLSKIEAGKMQLEYEDIEVRDLCSSIESLFKPFATQKEINFEVDLRTDVPATIQTDRMRLEQILKNLLSNAFKFTPAKGRISFIVSMATDDPHFVAFRVKDSGIGIAADKQSLIFEAFQQEDGSTRRKFGGTGLGLSISREIVKLLNGKIDLHSEVGKGSEFIAYVPVVALDINLPETPAEAVVERKTLPVTGPVINDQVPAASDDTNSFFNGQTDDRTTINNGDRVILIIEDDPVLGKILLDFTRTNGYRGLLATRGDEGIELAKQFKPMGVLLDVQLPVKNGWEVMDSLKRDTGTKDIPVHIMSANKLQKESLLKGADDFIDKPVAFEKIRDIFARLNESTTRQEKKVLIIEEDSKHASALAYFLSTSNINTSIKHDLAEGIDSLLKEDINCVILDTIATEETAYSKIDEVRRSLGLETLPIIVYTPRNLPKKEESYLKKHTDSVVVKHAYSYKRILDEVSLFLHAVDGENLSFSKNKCNKLGILKDVLRDKTVLVADDDVRNIFSLTKALEIYKIRVITAMDGKEALQKLHENPEVDIILMDMMMPEMDGYDATKEIKKDIRLKHIPVIAVTAKAMVGDREKCIEAGASDYITKPVDVDQLLSLLRVWLYESQYNRSVA